MRTALIAFGLLAASPAAAVIVNPGEQGFLVGTTVAARPDLAGTIIADSLSAYAITIADLGLTSTGQVQSRVVRRTDNGKLDFYWRVIPDPNSALRYSSFSVEPWTAGPVETEYRPDGLGSAGPNRLINNTGIAAAYDLSWFFPEVTPFNAASHFFFARSNAYSFSQTSDYFITVTGQAASGGTMYFRFDSGATYAPAVPEPSSWALLIVGFGLVGASLRRHRLAIAWRPAAGLGGRPVPAAPGQAVA